MVKEYARGRRMVVAKLLARDRCRWQSRHDEEAEAVVEKSQCYGSAWEKAILMDLSRLVSAATVPLMEDFDGCRWALVVSVK